MKMKLFARKHSCCIFFLLQKVKEKKSKKKKDVCELQQQKCGEIKINYDDAFINYVT